MKKLAMYVVAPQQGIQTGVDFKIPMFRFMSTDPERLTYLTIYECAKPGDFDIRIRRKAPRARRGIGVRWHLRRRTRYNFRQCVVLP